MIDELRVWAAEDTLLAELERQEVFDVGGADEVALGIGFPSNVEPRHVWITGNATGSLDDELSGGAPSQETFRISVVIYVQAPEEHAVVRDAAKQLAGGVEAALGSAAFRAVVPAWTLPDYRLEAGTDGTNRQVALTLVVECRCW